MVELGDLDIVWWVKFIFCFAIFVVAPVWLFNLVELNLLYKFGFTIAGAIGVGIALMGKSIRLHR